MSHENLPPNNSAPLSEDDEDEKTKGK